MIRIINENDNIEIKELLEILHDSTSSDLIEVKNYIKKISKLEHIKIIGFELNEKIVGMCTIARIEGLSYGGRPFAIIENVVVNKTAQGRGIGKKIVKQVIEIAEEWNCYKVILETGSKEKWKLSFYESCGLKQGSKTAFIKRFK